MPCLKHKAETAVKIHLSLADLNAYDPHDGHRRLCPLCGDGKPRDAAHRSLSYDAHTGLWKCFRCGEAGKLREFWEAPQPQQYQPPRQQSRQRLREAFQLSAPAPPHLPARLPQKAPEPPLIPETPRKPLKTALNGPESLSWQAHWEATTPLQGTFGEKYLARRGIPVEVAQVAGVRFAPSWFGQPSVVFPIQTRQGETIAAQGRAVRGTAKLTSGPKKNGVFFAPALKPYSPPGTIEVFTPLDRAIPSILLTEAPIDALSLAACGFPALALCGTSGPDWLHLACGLRRVELALDADPAGDEAAFAIADHLRPFGAQCRRLPPWQGKDWNECLMNAGQSQLSDWLTAMILLSEEDG